MTDPHSPTWSEIHSPRVQAHIDFITSELIPEMVHNRHFCEANSREFVEFESAVVTKKSLDVIRDTDDNNTSHCALYRVRANVKFSGETCSFHLIVKLPENPADTSIPSGSFQNEEMFYSKMTLKYGTDLNVPRCYLSDLGRYGRPVIVLEDLAVHGYVRLDRKLDEDHLKLCVKALGKFHGKGLRLKAKEFPIFREFYVKLSETNFYGNFVKHHGQNTVRILDILRLLPEQRLVEKIRGKLGVNPLSVMESLATEINDVSTVCHGRFTRNNVLFKYEDGKPCDVKVIDWQTMRYCSPGIDLGLILLANLPDNVLSKVRDILRLYLDTVKHEYPEMTYETLERDITAKLLFAYITLCTEEDITDGELLSILQVLDALGVFD